VVLVRTDVSAERIASIIRVARIGKLRMSAETRNRNTLRRNTMFDSCHPEYGGDSSSETSVLKRATRRSTPEVGILQVALTSHCFGIDLFRVNSS
jgi:hypothetical protein